MTTEQIIAFAPALLGLILAWFCGSGDLWRTLRCTGFAFISLLMTLQYSGWLTQWINTVIPQLDRDLFRGVVPCAMTLGLYSVWWMLYHRLWQPSLPASVSKNWWLYSVAGFGTGWVLGASLLMMLYSAELLHLPRMPVEGYSAVLHASAQFAFDQVAVFVP